MENPHFCNALALSVAGYFTDTFNGDEVFFLLQRQNGRNFSVAGYLHTLEVYFCYEFNKIATLFALRPEHLSRLGIYSVKRPGLLLKRICLRSGVGKGPLYRTANKGK